MTTLLAQFDAYNLNTGHSSFCLDSSFCNWCYNVRFSNQCEHCSNTYFSRSVHHLDRAIFCYGEQACFKSYAVFNKVVSKEYFNYLLGEIRSNDFSIKIVEHISDRDFKFYGYEEAWDNAFKQRGDELTNFITSVKGFDSGLFMNISGVEL